MEMCLDDAVAAFNMFIPTGRYTDGASDNTGLGMWGFEPMVGTTVFFDAKRQYHADVDKPRGGSLPIIHLDHTYGEHKPLGESPSARADHSTPRPPDRGPEKK